ncbi:MAG: HEPN domain-containing protein [Parcubacteria group bacterium]
MAEKFLKALLIFNNKSFRKVHDLLDLETSIMEFLTEIKDIHEDLLRLNRYYIQTRYPGDYPEFEWKEAEEALESAVRVKDFVFKYVKL